jgi:RNA polymerase sigma-70 factor (ECF subfamily)
MEEVSGLLPVEDVALSAGAMGAAGMVDDDAASFTVFYQSEYRAIVALAYGLTGNAWSAEELAQEAFAETYKRWEDLRSFERPGAWVRRVVLNRSVSRFRRARNEARMMLRLQARPSPRSVLHDDDAEFWRLVRSLPRRQAQVVALYYAEDMAIGEIAAVLSCAAGTIKAHLHAARRSLASQLGEPS